MTKRPILGRFVKMILRDLHTLFAVPACDHSVIGKILHLRLLLELSRITRIKKILKFINFLAYGKYRCTIFKKLFSYSN